MPLGSYLAHVKHCRVAVRSGFTQHFFKGWLSSSGRIPKVAKELADPALGTLLCLEGGKAL